ncbi:MAG TPA: hypothetical protein VMN60_09235 [Longimicrobiales bacterium]|nr:hypothetical protein [Longimicrobiales bacterium]
MIDRSENTIPPLPRDLLPDATAPANAPGWQDRLERIVALNEPQLQRLRAQNEMHWSTQLGHWWKAAAAIVLAATALLLALERPAARGQTELPLSVMAADGEPFAIWTGVGLEADPVLALIALQERAE